MGLLGFMKNVGASLFGKGKKEEEAIEQLLNEQLPGRITDLKVEFEDSVVTLTGTCDSKATKEKAVLLAGNVKGVSSVNDDNLEAPEEKEETEFYTIQKGDTLSKIAKAYYGNAMKILSYLRQTAKSSKMLISFTPARLSVFQSCNNYILQSL